MTGRRAMQLAKTTPSLKLSSKQRLQQGLYLGGIIAAFVLLLWLSGAFTQLRLRLSNIYFVPAEVSDTIVIVAIDNASIAEYGRFAEWPRSIYADLLDRLSAAKARVVAFDLLFDQPAAGDEALAQAIQSARAGEARTRVIMPAVGIQRAEDVQGGGQAIVFDNVLFPLRSFVDVVDNLGFVNVFPDVDSMIRRQPSLVRYQDETYVSFSIATYLAYKRIPTSAIQQVITSRPNELDLAAERPLYVDEYGFWVQNYFGLPSSVQPTFVVISLKDILAGNADMALFDDKIVLVGAMNNAGFVDQYPVPSDISGRPMTGVEIQANAIETLLQNRALREQSPLSQAVMIIALALVSSVIYTQLRWYWKLVAAFVLTVGWVLITLVIFSIQLEIINLFHGLLALFLALLGAIFIDITQEIRRRRKTEFLLESVVAITKQRLALDSILAHIAADLRRITNAPRGAIWLLDTEQAQFNAAYMWPQTDGNTFEAIAHKAAEEQTQIIEGKSIATPVIWQGQALATLVVHLAEDKRPTQEMLNLLDLLARQLAPNLDNALLYRKVKRQKALLEAIFDGSPAGIMVLNKTRHIQQVNQAAERIFGIKLEHCVGQSINDLLVAAKSNEDAFSTLDNYFTAAQPFRMELKLNEKTFTIDGAMLAAHDEWILIINDISALAELSELKTHMIRMAAHDLKNPLGRILGFGQLLEMATEDEVAPSQRGYITSIMEAGYQMNQIISDVLNLEQLRSRLGNRTPHNMAEVIENVVTQQKPEATRKGQTLTTSIAPNLPPVLADANLLWQVVTNLVSNAIKYTPEGGHLEVRLDYSDGMLRLEVEDNGYGIPEKAQEKLFTEFYRVKTAATRHISGTGLGLSLVKSVVEAYGGRVWVKSAEGVGSTFFVELPAVGEEDEL